MTEAKTGHLKNTPLNLPAASKEKMAETQKRFQARKRLDRVKTVLDWVRK